MIRLILQWISNQLNEFYIYRHSRLTLKKKCINCEHLLELLENERAERVKLVNKLLDKNVIEHAPKEINDDAEWQALQNNARSRVNRAILSRQSFQRMEDNKKEFEAQQLKEKENAS